ncbi:MAG: hypothetical protein WAM43_17090, partial [Terriglobales bacterium]
MLSVIPEQFHKLSEVRLSRENALNRTVEVITTAGPSYREAKVRILRPPTLDLHRKRIPPIHHIQRVIALTDIPRAIRENEIGLAKAELCPSPETDLQA